MVFLMHTERNDTVLGFWRLREWLMVWTEWASGGNHFGRLRLLDDLCITQEYNQWP